MPEISFVNSDCQLQAAPIPASWIKAGHPDARRRIIYVSEDKTTRTMIWDCTAGCFDWIYDDDETVFVIEGSVDVKTDAGTNSLRAGDTVYFPAGTRAEWTVAKYVRKFAILRVPLGKDMQLALRLSRSIRRRANLPR